MKRKDDLFPSHPGKQSRHGQPLLPDHKITDTGVTQWAAEITRAIDPYLKAVPNGSFEYPGTAGVAPDSWTTIAGTFGTNWTTSNSYANAGALCAVFAQDVVATSIRSAKFKVGANDNIVVSTAFARIVHPFAGSYATRNLNISLRYYDKDQAFVSQVDTVFNMGSFPGGGVTWYVNKLNLTVPATACYAEVQFTKVTLLNDWSFALDAVTVDALGATFRTTQNGLVPAPGSVSGAFLKDDGSWTTTGTMEGQYAPGSLTVADGKFRVMTKNLQLTGTQRATLQGTGRIRIT